MANKFKITEYPIKVLSSQVQNLVNVQHLLPTIKVDFAFADITTEEGDCTMFKIPITTTIVNIENSLLIFELKTRNNYDIYNFQAEHSVEILKKCIRKAYEMHCQMDKKLISEFPFHSILLPPMNSNLLNEILLKDIQMLYTKKN